MHRQNKLDSSLRPSSVEEERERKTRRVCGEGGPLEMDIVSHDVKKFFRLLLKKNGYVLEQLYSPLIVHTTPEHAELKAICNPRQSDTSPNPLPGRGGDGVITKNHSHPISALRRRSGSSSTRSGRGG